MLPAAEKLYLWAEIFYIIMRLMCWQVPNLCVEISADYTYNYVR